MIGTVAWEEWRGTEWTDGGVSGVTKREHNGWTV